MLQTGDDRLSGCRQPGNYQRRSAPQIGAFHRRPLQAGNPLYHCHPSVYPDTGAHAGQFVHIFIPILKNALHKHAGPRRHAGCRQQRRSGIGGKSGIGHGTHRSQLPQTGGSDQAERVAVRRQGAAPLLQQRQHRGDMRRTAPPQGNVTPCSGRRRQIGRRLDAVGHHRIYRSVKRFYPLDLQHPGRGRMDTGAAGVEKPAQVVDLRLLCRMVQHGLPPGGTRRQQHIFRRPHAGKRQHDLRPLQPARRQTTDIAVLLPDLRPQTAQRRQMQIDGAGAQLAAPGVGQLRLAAAGKNGSQKHNRGTHLPHQAVGDLRPGERRCVHRHRMYPPLRPAPQMPQYLQSHPHIRQAGAMLQSRRAVAQQRRRQQGQGAVFSAVNGHRPPQRRTALYP